MAGNAESKSVGAKIRVFIALPAPQAVKEELKRAQSELRSRLSNDVVRWTRPEQIHLTLRFLGNIAGENVTQLIEAATIASGSFAPIPLRAEEIGFFPSERRPRVIWSAVRDDRGELNRLQAAISRTAAPFAAEPGEKEFAAHLTLGRVREMSASQSRWLAEAGASMKDRRFGTWTADKIEIIRSELGSEGSRYTCLAEIALRGKS